MGIISRKKLIRLTQWIEWRRRGCYWASFVQTFLNWDKLIIYGGIISLKFPSISLYLIIVVLGVAGIVMEFVKLFIGKQDFKRGIQEIQNEWLQKTRQVAPHNVEVRETLKAICQKLNIPHHFKDL